MNAASLRSSRRHGFPGEQQAARENSQRVVAPLLDALRDQAAQQRVFECRKPIPELGDDGEITRKRSAAALSPLVLRASMALTPKLLSPPNLTWGAAPQGLTCFDRVVLSGIEHGLM